MAYVNPHHMIHLSISWLMKKYMQTHTQTWTHTRTWAFPVSFMYLLDEFDDSPMAWLTIILLKETAVSFILLSLYLQQADVDSITLSPHHTYWPTIHCTPQCDFIDWPSVVYCNAYSMRLRWFKSRPQKETPQSILCLHKASPSITAVFQWGPPHFPCLPAHDTLDYKSPACVVSLSAGDI